MRKRILLLISFILLLSIFLGSCVNFKALFPIGKDESETETETETETGTETETETETDTETDTETETEIDTLPPYVNESYVYEQDVSLYDFTPEKYKYLEQFYIDKPITGDIEQAFYNFCESHKVPYTPPVNFNLSDLDKIGEIKCLPIYGPYMEYTSLVACMVYDTNGEYWFYSVFVADETENGVELSSINTRGFPFDNDINSIYHGKFDRETIHEQYITCLKWLPYFNIVGLKYGSSAFIGYIHDEPYLYSCDDSFSNDAQLVYEERSRKVYPLEGIKSVKTVEEAQIEYKKLCANIIESISKVPFGYTSWNNISYDVNGDYEVSVELVDANGYKGKYFVSLVYKNGNLMSETIVERINGVDVPIVKKTVKMDMVFNPQINGYEMLYEWFESQYISEVNDLLRRVEDPSAVKGVGFDGEKFFLAYEILAPEPPQKTETSGWQH